MNIILTSLTFRYILNYWELPWINILIFSVFLSSTLPVNIVNILKDLGASSKVWQVIDGEGTINGGASMSLFILLVKIAKKSLQTPFDITFTICRSYIEGLLVGLIFGFVGVYWLSKIVHDYKLIALITFVLAELVFFMCEFTFSFMRCSGVLALIALGLFFAAFGKTSIYE